MGSNARGAGPAVLVLTLAVALAFAAASIFVPANCSMASDKTLGINLELGMWADIKDKRFDVVATKIAPGFISVHQDGARGRDAELGLIRGLDIEKYRLSDFTVTRQGASIVVSYMVSVEETIEGERLSKEPAARLSVWQMTEDGWQWIAHANLKPLK